MRDNESNTMRCAPMNSQPPQASASTNSAIRAELSIADEESQETGAVSSGEAAVDKFPVLSVAKVFQELPAGNQTNFSAAARRRVRVEGAGFTHKILERRGRRPSKFSGSKRMSAALFAEVEAQKNLLAGCRGCSSADCIYVLVQRDGVGRIKIGTTIDPYQRTGSHQSNAFGELKLLAAFHGDKNDERALHHRFADDLVYGHREHFYPSKRLVRWVEDVVRLNGRDDGLCWSCRDAVLVKKTRALTPSRFDRHVIDLRCGDSCDSTPAWFERDTRRITHGRTTTWGFSATPIITASGLIEAPSAHAWCCALFLLADSISSWIDEERVRRGGLTGDVWAHGLELCRSMSSRMHHKASVLLPGTENFPRRSRGDGPLADRASLALAYLSGFLEKHGVVRVCCCPGTYTADVNRLIQCEMELGHTDLLLVPSSGREWEITDHGRELIEIWRRQIARAV